MGQRFKGKTVWITGASAGIGASLAKEFINEGATVALSGRRTERLNSVAAQLGERAHAFAVDVQNHEALKKTAQSIAEKLGSIDVVVANAGYAAMAPFEKLTEEMWRNLFETNVFGVVWTIYAALPYLKKTHGRVAIVSSVRGKVGHVSSTAYSASKFALMGLASSLYLELKPSGVSVTTLSPGMVESEINTVDNLGRPKDPSAIKLRQSRFMWPTDRAAKDMVSAIYRRNREAVITGHAKIISFFGSHFPSLMYWGIAKARATRDR